MKSIIELKTAKGITAYLKHLNRKDGTASLYYQLKTDSNSVRIGETVQGRQYIQPQGCSMIEEGKKLNGTDIVVAKIITSDKFGFVIRIENDNTNQ